MGERLVCTEEVRGSSPLVSTFPGDSILRKIPVAVILTFLIFQLILVLAFPLRVNPDIHFFSAIGNRITSGEIPYIDFYSGNLPLIQYLYVPAAKLGRWFGVNGVSVWLLLTYAQLAASLVVCYRLARVGFGQYASIHLLLLPSLALAGISWYTFFTYNFGQREHLFVIYTFPWLLMRFCTWEGRSIRRLPTLFLGAVVGVATAIKPYYFLVIGAVELYWFLRFRQLRPLRSYEVYGFVCANLIYMGLLVASPEVFQGVLDMIEQNLVYHFVREPGPPLDVSIYQSRISLIIGILAMCLSLIRKHSTYRILGAISTFTFLGAVIVELQASKHDYQHLILYAGALLCTGVLILMLASEWRGNVAERYVGSALYAFVLFFAFYHMMAQWQRLDYVRVKTPKELRDIVEHITEPGDDVFFMTGQLGFVYPWFGLEGLNQITGMPDPWVLPLHDDSDLAAKTLAYYVRLTRRDIDASPPVIIIDKRTFPETLIPEFLKRYGLLEAIHSRYRLVGASGQIEVYQYVDHPPLQATTFEFNGRFTLYSWDFDNVGACQFLELRTWWRPGSAPDLEAYTLHVDLVSKDSGAPLAERSGRIGAVDDYSDWSSLRDSQQLTLPCDEAVGTVMLLVSLEDMSVAGGRLLSVHDSRGADYGHYAYLGEFSLDAGQK